MANMSELSMVLDSLVVSTQALADATDGLFGAVKALRMLYSTEAVTPSADAEVKPVDQPEKPTAGAEPEKTEPEKVYEFTDVRRVLAGLSSAGHSADVKRLIAEYGAAKLSDIKPESYAELVQKAEAIANA